MPLEVQRETYSNPQTLIGSVYALIEIKKFCGVLIFLFHYIVEPVCVGFADPDFADPDFAYLGFADLGLRRLTFPPTYSLADGNP